MPITVPLSMPITLPTSMMPPDTTGPGARPPARPRPGRWPRVRALLAHLAAVIVPFVVYAWTTAPGVGLGDTALLLDEIAERKIHTHVNNHNLTILVGWLATHLPLGTIPHRANLASALIGACAVALFYGVVWRTFRRRATAVLGMLVLMVSHSMWWHSTIIECYAMNGLFTVAATGLLVLAREADGRGSPGDGRAGDDGSGWAGDRALLGLFALAGLALFNHVQMGIIALAAALLLLLRTARLARTAAGRRRLPALVGLAVLAFLAGFLPYLVTFIRDLRQLGDLEQTVRQATVGSFQSIMFRGTVGHGLRDLGSLIAMQFPSPALVAVIAGCAILVRSWRRSAALAGLALMLLVNAVFFMFYNTWDKFAFLLPTFVILAFAGAFGIDHVTRRTRGRSGALVLAVLAVAIVAMPAILYGQLSRWGRDPGPWHARWNNDYTENSHDAAEYIANPNKRHWNDVEEFADLVFDRLPPGAVYIDDDSRVYYPIHYLQRLENRRPDLQVRIINSWGFSGWGLSEERFATHLRHAYENDRPLYVVTLDWPFRHFIARAAELGVETRFERFDLDARRWIYRLQTRAELGDGSARLPYRPNVRALRTGLAFNTPSPVRRQRFSPGEPIMAALDFETSTGTFAVRFRWLGPDGRVHHEGEEFVVPLANTRTWTFLEGPRPLSRGTWRVMALADDDTLATTTFVIE